MPAFQTDSARELACDLLKQNSVPTTDAPSFNLSEHPPQPPLH